MLAKLKIYMGLLASIFATTVLGVIFAGCQGSKSTPDINTALKRQHDSSKTLEGGHADNKAPENVASSERSKYKPIPLETINYSLQGRDPADLALNTFEEVESSKGTRKVEVAYPQPDRALVIVTQTVPENNYLKKVKYRVEFATFGRSLLVNSPRAWQIVWAGSRKQCMFETYSRIKPISCGQTLER